MSETDHIETENELTPALRALDVELAEQVMWWPHVPMEELTAYERDGGIFPCYSKPETDFDWDRQEEKDERLIYWGSPDADGERWSPTTEDAANADVLDRMVYLGWDVVLVKQIGQRWEAAFDNSLRRGSGQGSRRLAICEAALSVQSF